MLRKLITIFRKESRVVRTLTLLEKELGRNLPKVYKDFMCRADWSGNNYMIGSDWRADKLYDLQEWAAELLEENNFQSLPAHAFVFWMHQGYQFSFFILNGDDNPPVYHYSEGQKETGFVKSFGKLSDFYS